MGHFQAPLARAAAEVDDWFALAGRQVRLEVVPGQRIVLPPVQIVVNVVVLVCHAVVVDFNGFMSAAAHAEQCDRCPAVSSNARAGSLLKSAPPSLTL